MATHSDSYIAVTTCLYNLPTFNPYSAEAGFAFVNPKLVIALEPEEIVLGDSENTPEGVDVITDTISGTRVVTAQEIYFVPLPLVEVADKLDIQLFGLKQEASA
jgi:hypothetical protein